MMVTVNFIDGNNAALRGEHARMFYDAYTYAVSTKNEHFMVKDGISRTHFHMSRIVFVTARWEE